MPENNNAASTFQLLLTPEKAAIAAGQTTTLRVLARIQAPSPPAGTIPRQPLHLALVLDRSGSMNGLPLEEAKRCARNIIDSLAPGDRTAVFAFDDEIVQVAPLTPAANKLALATALATIESGGSTNLHGGWRAGADELAAKLAGKDLHRVILLSDGCANAGELDLEQIALQCRDMAKGGVSTSTYGLGENFNESLMLAMAAAGRGNAYYGQTAADLAEPFAAEFALLTSLCARGLVLKVNASAGIGVKLRNDFVSVEGEATSWSLPDLAFAAEAWAVLEFDIPAIDGGMGTSVKLPITVSVQAATPDSTPLFLLASVPTLPLMRSEQIGAMAAEELVARRIMELDAADALSAVQVAIAADNWLLAQQLVEAAQGRFAQHEWAAAILGTMRRLVGERNARRASKEAVYASHSMRNRLASFDEASSIDFDALSIPAFLRRKPEQGKGERDI